MTPASPSVSVHGDTDATSAAAVTEWIRTDPGHVLVCRCRTRQVGLLLPRLFALLLQRGHGQEDALQQPDPLRQATGEVPVVAPPTPAV